MDRNELKRRSFLAAVPAAAAVRSGKAQQPAGGSRPSASFPGTQYYGEEEKTGLVEAIESRSLFRWYGPGKPQKVARFEEDFAGYMGSKYTLAVTSGTAALHCALTALGVGPGDEVILPAWGWLSCYNSILLTGALPVFAEVDRTLNIDPADMERKITPRTKAIMVIHLYGCPADLDPILAVARKHQVKVLEDTAQSLGAEYKGRRAGSIGEIGIYSFQIAKTLTAGEGGAVVTNDPVLFERAARFHDLGMLRPPHEAMLGKASVPLFLGTNYRMNEMTGAVMGAQLRKLDKILSLFRRNYSTLAEQIQNVPGLELRRLPDPQGQIGNGLFLFFKTKDARDRFIKAMRAERAPAGPPGGSHYLPGSPYIEQKVAPHAQWPTFHTPEGRAMRYGAQCCPRTVEIYDRCATVSIGPKYRDSDLKEIAQAIIRAHRAAAG